MEVTVITFICRVTPPVWVILCGLCGNRKFKYSGGRPFYFGFKLSEGGGGGGGGGGGVGFKLGWLFV